MHHFIFQRPTDPQPFHVDAADTRAWWTCKPRAAGVKEATTLTSGLRLLPVRLVVQEMFRAHEGLALELVEPVFRVPPGAGRAAVGRQSQNPSCQCAVLMRS